MDGEGGHGPLAPLALQHHRAGLRTEGHMDHDDIVFPLRNRGRLPTDQHRVVRPLAGTDPLPEQHDLGASRTTDGVHTD